MRMKYNLLSDKAESFLNAEEISRTLEYAVAHRNDKGLISDIMAKARKKDGLNHQEAAVLLLNNDPELTSEIKLLAEEIKLAYYGNRIVLFAPLYLSNFCINGCTYCPYHAKNHSIPRKKLTQDEIAAEVRALQKQGHKRLALEAGEDPKNNPLEYILESIETIYGIHEDGVIRRVNVNIAATTIENYKRLHAAKIGTYILFQETYNRQGYEALHPRGPKSDYLYHTEAMDRAMQAGIEDVGLGVLFGLQNYAYEFVGLLMHAEHLDGTYGAGPHTISVPRLRPADDIDVSSFKNALPDDVFLKLIALIRISVPYTGMIMSTRESEDIRKEALNLGISQISGGSKTTVGGYAKSDDRTKNSAQFEVSDNRTLDEVVNWLMRLGYVPSFCTACYGSGRQGVDFMDLCKKRIIHNFCTPNALLTLMEYINKYASPETKKIGTALLEDEMDKLPYRVSEKLLSRLQTSTNEVEFY